MRVLLTNHTLAGRAGTELYIRDLAIELVRRGHQPVCYSRNLGEVADELRAAAVPVVSGLEQLGVEPGIIHGHHHRETLTAMLWFPRTPAISYCHGWAPPDETPLRFPRIFRYVAVSELNRERLIAEGGIAPEKVELIFNFFDARRFPAREPLPARPRTALAFCNYFHEQDGLPVLREACRRCGVTLQAVGLASSYGVENHPGALLARQDIVFARGRSAIEAMGVGAAVILAEPGRLGPMVTRANFDYLQRQNFAMRALTEPLTVDAVVKQLQRYDALDATEVSRTTHAHCELQPAADRIIALYETVLAEARQNPPGPSDKSDRAVIRYLDEYMTRFQANLEGKLAASVQREYAALQELAALRGSASWRVTQRILANPAVKWIFGRPIKSVALASERKTVANPVPLHRNSV